MSPMVSSRSMFTMCPVVDSRCIVHCVCAQYNVVDSEAIVYMSSITYSNYSSPCVQFRFSNYSNFTMCPVLDS